MGRRKFALKMYYIGSKKFYGSQRQNNALTIENCILNALLRKKYIKDIKRSTLEFASRTDRFVSARAACFSFITERKPILMEINSALPKEIGVWACSEVPINFSSRFNAILRHYKYIVPESNTILQEKHSINFEFIKKACKELEGSHDFINFSKRENLERKTVRELKLVNFNIINDFIIFDFLSKAFLRQQIRRMVKKILELGMGEINYDDFLLLFDSSRDISYQPADPRGLILWDIIYDENVNFLEDQKSKERMKNYLLNKQLNFQFKHQLFRILQGNNSR
ncbi:MAG: tRNA pseudouridine synthase A [Promethearchaeota archaeon]